MLIAALVLALTGIQPAADPPAPVDDPFIVDDPFDLEPEPAPGDQEPAVESGPAAAQAPAPPSSKRLICRSRPELGTRLRYVRVCMTALEWELHETHMEQQRRDINDWGAQGQGPPR